MVGLHRYLQPGTVPPGSPARRATGSELLAGRPGMTVRTGRSMSLKGKYLNKRSYEDANE